MPKIVSSRSRTLKTGERPYDAHGIATDVLGASWFLPAPSYSIGSTIVRRVPLPAVGLRIRDDTPQIICSDVIRTTTSPHPAPHCAHRELVAAASSRSLPGASKCAETWV